MSALTKTPEILAHLADQIKAWDTPTGPNRFSPREAVAHLADWEPLLRERMKSAHETPGAEIKPFDESELAVLHNYASSDPKVELAKFREERNQTIDWLKGLSKADWTKSYLHPERGLMTIYDTANMIACHDVYHIEQFSTVLSEKTAGTW